MKSTLLGSLLLLIVSSGIGNADTRSYEEGLRQHCNATNHRESDYEKCVMRGIRPPQINSFLEHDPAYKGQPFVERQSSSTLE